MYRPRDQAKSYYRKKCEPRESWLVAQVVGQHGGHSAWQRDGIPEERDRADRNRAGLGAGVNLAASPLRAP